MPTPEIHEVRERVLKTEITQEIIVQKLDEISAGLKENRSHYDEQQKELKERVSALEHQLSRVKGIIGGVTFLASCLWAAVTFYAKNKGAGDG